MRKNIPKKSKEPIEKETQKNTNPQKFYKYNCCWTCIFFRQSHASYSNNNCAKDDDCVCMMNHACVSHEPAIQCNVKRKCHVLNTGVSI